MQGKRGITPVIAIILLLLMTVAAAGGFYYVYKQFSSTGEETGSSQIGSLGEQSLSGMKIESVAAGKIYIRNTGATDIDTTKLTVFVDDVPVDTEPNTETIAENSRATLKLIEVVNCTGECTVKVSGPGASDAKNVQASKLFCSSSTECSSTETCLNSICRPGRDELLIVMDSNLTARMISYNGVRYVVTDMFDWTDDFDATRNAVIGDVDGDGMEEVIVGGFTQEE